MIHLNITMDERLFRRLKARAPKKGLSAFVAAAVEARLRPSRDELETAYQAATSEPWRQALADEWSAVDGESWPE